MIARRLAPELELQPGEAEDDVIQGCLAVALKRASLFGRAPVVHDWRIAFTIWGFYDPDPPDDLLALRRRMFEGVGNTLHHYTEARRIADIVHDATLRMTPALVDGGYPERWRSLLGVTSGDAA